MRTGHARLWRRGSTYSEPPRNQLDRGQRHLWRRRVVAEARAGNLPGKAILTAEALIACMGEDGQLYPSHQAVAGKAGVGLRTVARHLERMAALGLLTRIRRLVRRPWPEGGRGAVRVEQTSNAYILTFPVGAVTWQSKVSGTVPRTSPQALAKSHSETDVLRTVRETPSALSTGCHSGAEESGSRFIHPSELDRMAALAALEAVRMAREAANAARWWAGRGQ